MYINIHLFVVGRFEVRSLIFPTVGGRRGYRKLRHNTETGMGMGRAGHGRVALARSGSNATCSTSVNWNAPQHHWQSSS